ncbi:ABC transporter ATP-binding protein [Bacillus safensis]|jgi:iron complex transport system ATP-binding protein|uniref:ABC transporter ATP-binding protein n=14 Tax=Bacteria TaxID=2 RepID=A0AC61ZVK9_BACIA|nr:MULTISPECIES: ABC transporter ATP-binding protein [Bacillus]KML04547.1 ABC transporter [Bacillus stratosphericus]KQL43307.1 ABC transporter [Bacillus sp. FJAT-21955]MBW3702417.1 ABC transporter ATP-binding protein [Bacillus aerophilus]MBW4854506.1 ABC transporter ATP-binding protein [Bacillaceae bacterium]MDH8708852.1 iron complex transport system ATP-binding protein [Micromonospora sp. 1209]CVN22450.1 ferric enterobactin transport ATP-binding protein FepC [Streptococcus pneumoniae]
MSAISTEGLSLGYGETMIIDELNVSIPKGEITVFIGSNGCGKSTLLRSLARLMKPMGGSVLLEGHSIAKLPTKEVAKQLAILPQGPEAPEGLTVHQLVKQGRYPYQNWLKQWSKQDEEAVNRALKSTKMEDLADRTVDSLSGGQRQRAWIAMTLAQETDIILLDEPTTYLDMTHQIEILDLLFDLNEKEQRTIVMVLHDLNLACRYAHHLVAIKDKSIYAEGRPETVINCDLVKNVFDMNCQVTTDPLFGTPLCIPHGRGRCIVQQAQAETFLAAR